MADVLVPVLDFGPYLDEKTIEEERSALLEELARQLREACRDVGFYFLKGADLLVPDALVQEMFDVTRRFHDLDMQKKLSCAMDPKARNQMGYLPNIGDAENPEMTARKEDDSKVQLMTSTSNFAEAFFASRGYGAELQANPFPDRALPEMREVVSRYDAAVHRLAARMLPVYARALKLPEEALLGMFTAPSYVYRLAHYPETPPAVGRNGVVLYGAAPHADTSFFTILAQTEVPGLSILHPSGVWMPVQPMPRTFVVNTGEILHRLSNGNFVNTIHRVENHSGQERYAVVAFLNLDREAVMDPVVEPGQEVRFTRFTPKEVFKEKTKPGTNAFQSAAEAEAKLVGGSRAADPGAGAKL